MNILSIIGFLSNLFNIGNFFADIWFWILLFLDGLAYTLLAYSFKLFQLMCTLNFNSLYGLISPILTRIKALVMVFVVYKLGISLINFMLNPDEAAKKGKEILINIFITAALLLTYNTIFGVFNELSMLIIGTPENYTFVYLSTIADITDAKDSGLINRLVFGTTEEMPDVGEFIAFSVASTFITDANDPQNTEPLRSAITDPNTGKLDFNMLKELNSDIGKKFDYFYLVGFIAAGFMIFSFVKTTIQIGVRAFKLLILQVIAPIAIITIIGEGTKGKTFKNFVNKYIAVYLEAFIRMFSLLLVCNFVVKFIRNLTDYFPSINTDEWYTYGLMIVLIIIAAFKFATDIPKFIDEILSTHLSTGKEKNFIGGLLGAGIGLAAGLRTRTLSGAIAGLTGGAKAGSKGNSIADFIKGQAQNNQHARDIGADSKAVGGHIPGLSSLRYGMTRLGGAMGVPQAKMERGKLAAERQTAMDNMVKTIEDNYDRKLDINGSQVGISRDLFRSYAYKKGDKNKMYEQLSLDVQGEVDKTNNAYEKYQAAQGAYDELKARGASADALGDAWNEVETTRSTYQALKATTDKKVDTEYNSMMIRDARAGKLIKSKGKHAVSSSIASYDHVTKLGYGSRSIAAGRHTTKEASDKYTTQQDRTTHSRTVQQWNNSNLRGGGGGGSSK